ncbi:MAG TPA: rhomboid family intramembrane serine protease [Verrucomicrobiales bacterium]|jgi:membrane associated rhomboid family serine protease|nr:rhomboid family intramembrane serine protease [Verrucomicrobiales bacterium]
MFLIFPTSVETLERYHPWLNWLLIAATVFVFFTSGMGRMGTGVEPYVLQEWNLKQFAGHLFLHAGFMHLLGNMIFLWVFGNVICQTTGNLLYPLLYFGTGFGAAAVHLAIDGGPAVGASGAVSGLTGLALALFPLNRVNFAYVVGSTGGNFTGRVWALCLVSVIWDLLGAVMTGSRTAHWAHIGGLLTGVLTGLAMLAFGWIQLSCYDNRSLYEMLTGKELDRLDDEVEITGGGEEIAEN